MIDLLCLLLYPAIVGLARPTTHWFLMPVTLLAWVVDCLANYTTISMLVGEFPRWGEWTFSQRLERLCKEPSPDQQLFIQIALKLNRVDPLHCHIKAVL